MALYPNILFHLTNKESLYGILNKSFKISYAREKIVGGNITEEFAVPMVSFSDLRLSELKDNVKTYGKFGIGLTKEWAIKNGLSPVMYVSEKSLFIEKFLKEIGSPLDSDTDIADEHKLVHRNILCYIKNYQGDLSRRNKKIKKNYVFANEREWRYVPAITESIAHFVHIKEIASSKQKSLLNEKLNHLKLDFVPDDIKYLIVENECDISTLIEHVTNAKQRFTSEAVKRLLSRILTYEQIKDDI